MAYTAVDGAKDVVTDPAVSETGSKQEAFGMAIVPSGRRLVPLKGLLNRGKLLRCRNLGEGAVW